MSKNWQEDSMKLLDRFRQGDQDAADELFQRHVGRLVALAHKRISPQLGRRIDAEDVVQSALGTFFKHAVKGRYTVTKQGDLWRLLAAITINKVRQKVEFHSAAKRKFAQDQAADNTSAMEFLAREPAPDAELEVIEEIEMLTEGLDEVQQKMVRLRLEGCELNDIAQQVSRSERTVRRVISKIKERLQQRVADMLHAEDED